jgi:cytochrome c biogenesis protein CcmG, thiol:disulfide interchange protein DsbE
VSRSPSRASAASRSRSRRSGGASSPTRLVAAAVIVAIVLALVLGALIGTGDNGGDTRTNAGVPSDALPELTDPGPDPAAGMTMPTLTGTTQDGEPMTFGPDGRAKIIVYLAHWCPHCQAEVPVVQDWVDAGNLPDSVDLLTVSTAIDERRPNYPPDEWLEREGWTAPVLVDDDGSAAQASGLSAFPFFVAVDADGTVVGRASGQLTPTQLSQIADLVAEGGAS